MMVCAFHWMVSGEFQSLVRWLALKLMVVVMEFVWRELIRFVKLSSLFVFVEPMNDFGERSRFWMAFIEIMMFSWMKRWSEWPRDDEKKLMKENVGDFQKNHCMGSIQWYAENSKVSQGHSSSTFQTSNTSPWCISFRRLIHHSEMCQNLWNFIHRNPIESDPNTFIHRHAHRMSSPLQIYIFIMKMLLDPVTESLSKYKHRKFLYKFTGYQWATIPIQYAYIFG